MDELVNGPILVAGSDGMIGRQLLADLRTKAATVLPFDGLDGSPTALWRLRDTIHRTRPRLIFYVPAERYGIAAHRRAPATIHYDCVLAFAHLMEAARRARVGKVVNVLSHCVYPGRAPVPYRETDVWKGLPEPPLAPYGVGRRLSLVHAAACRAQYGLRTVSLILASVYGPHDNFDPLSAQVMAAMIRRFVTAADRGEPRVVCWGTGRATRELLHVRDAARGILEAAVHYDAEEPLNIGNGREAAIGELSRLVARAAGYQGEIGWDTSKPDGRPRVSLDTRRMRALLPSWKMMDLEEGVAHTVQWFRAATGTETGQAPPVGSAHGARVA